MIDATGGEVASHRDGNRSRDKAAKMNLAPIANRAVEDLLRGTIHATFRKVAIPGEKTAA